jgi:4a-hydroxytetrahydrobiopterin dehydratase
MSGPSEPTAIRIAAQGARLEIEWSDGVATALEGRTLRRECPCARCAERRGGKAATPAAAEVVVSGVEAAGASALRVAFADGHGLGVFTYERLRALANAALPKDAPDLPAPAPRAPGALDAASVGARLHRLPGWSAKPDALEKTFAFASYPRALAFLVEVGFLAERANHHPDALVRYRDLTLTLTTHDAGGITDKDLRLAAEIEGIAP